MLVDTPGYIYGIAYGDIVVAAIAAMSALTAIWVAITTIREQRRIARRNHTLDVVLTRFSNPESAALYSYVLDYQATKPQPDGKQEDAKIREALNMYEYIAFAARGNILDPDVLIELRGGSMRRTFEFFKPYIHGQRQGDNNPRLWEHYEWFVKNVVEARLQWKE
jgi:hypothetical protein